MTIVRVFKKNLFSFSFVFNEKHFNAFFAIKYGHYMLIGNPFSNVIYYVNNKNAILIIFSDFVLFRFQMNSGAQTGLGLGLKPGLA